MKRANPELYEEPTVTESQSDLDQVDWELRKEFDPETIDYFKKMSVVICVKNILTLEDVTDELMF